MRILDTPDRKVIVSDNYHLLFNKKTGFTARWGKTKDDDPQFSPLPEILDMEISTGSCMGKCPQCYKLNDEPFVETKHMTLDTFKRILDRFDCNGVSCLTQIAFGLTDTTSNPDFWNILEECGSRGVIPNFTTHGLDITPEIADRVSKLCGAVAVSIVNKQKTYDAVKMFAAAGMKQVNIHLTIYRERLKQVNQVIEDVAAKLPELNAIVFLTYKPKGRNVGKFTNLSRDEFKSLITRCEELGVLYGFDSCSAYQFEQCIDDHQQKDRLLQLSERCESGCFSSYCSVDGKYFACSFAEGVNEWKDGIDLLSIDHFLKVWNGEQNLKWREKLLQNERKCPLFDIYGV